MTSLFTGDLPDRLRKSAIMVGATGLAYIVGALAAEGMLAWNDPFAVAGVYTLAGVSIAASIHHHALRLQQALSRWLYLRGTALDAVLLVTMAALIGRPDVMTLIGVARTFVVLAKIFVHTGAGRRIAESFLRNPAKLVVASFAFMILIGTVMLMFPRATTDGAGAPWYDALFTAASANCVTGLVVMNTNLDIWADPNLQSFSFFGQMVILVLIQFGGLGIMTLSTSAVLLMGGKLSLKGRSLMANVLEEDGTVTVTFMIRYIVLMTLAFEAVGAAILSLRFVDLFPDEPGVAVYHGVFHAISAFCNAGFSLFGDNLAGFVTDPAVNATVSLLIIFGGIGFTVIAVVFSRQTWSQGLRMGVKKLTVHARLAIVTSACLIAGGMLALLVLDGNGAQEGLSVVERLMASYFQSVSARTAGFNTIDIGQTARAAVLLYIFLMFVGASPGGTGGGIKTTTLAILVLSVRATLLGRMDVEVHGRTVPRRTVYKAVAITLLSAIACVVVAIVLVATQEGLTTEQVLFEVVSAFGTVGLSMGATPGLDVMGKVMITILMYLGRVGPLTMTLALGQQSVSSEVRYPECRVVVG